MQPADRSAFVAILNGLAAIKPNAKLTAEAYEIWWLAMRGWDIDDFRAAAAHVARSIAFMPSPYDFEQLRKAGELTAGEAWQLALGGGPLEPGSRTARAAAIVGGQQRMRMADIERDLPHIQRRFMEVYDELTDVDAVRVALPGISAVPALVRRFGEQRVLGVTRGNEHE